MKQIEAVRDERTLDVEPMYHKEQYGEQELGGEEDRST